VLSRVKIMASMDIAEKRLPQDGRITVNLSDNKKIDLRVSSLPASYGESIVMRILDKSSLVLGLEHLGFLLEDKKKFEGLINIPHGIILVTGPTGSGKTTTLYTCLNYLNRPDEKIVTLEDPVEYELSGINHMQIQPKVGMTFASGLRAILRQAPNVVMVGEIRDSETAETAMRAALTGHLIFSTLHTNDAPGAITRLIDIDISPYLIASTVEGIIAQRLVRVVCPDCREEYAPAKEELDAFGVKGDEAWITDVIKEIGSIKFAKGKGCRKCMQTGYKGRLGIFELLIMSDTLRRLIYTKAPQSVLKAKAVELGMRTLRQDAIRKVFAGITTPSEVARVASE
ncbi:MAG: type II/IV secretion system protein, partial [Candidatus Omnitrophica bacterium]|nr:type II/IV secretion system protein [Candidatus Omnitrophota bacterium]